jgi:transposase
MPESLPREHRHHELSEAERVCQGCGRLRIDIGADKSEQLDYWPSSLFVIDHFVHKYVCPCCSRRAHNAQGQQPQPCSRSSRRRGFLPASYRSSLLGDIKTPYGACHRARMRGWRG